MKSKTMSPTTISKELLKAYKATDFIVFNGQDTFTLRVGRDSKELKRLLRNTSIISACYITAWNPFSKTLSPARNKSNQAKLISYIKGKRLPYLHGIGRSKDLKYHEDSILVLGCSKELSIDLGRKFKQNAVVYYQSGSCVEILLLK